jgi:phosphomannomutase
MPLIKSISGLRATLKDSLFPQIISDYTAAFAELQGEGEIVVGRDGRPSGEWVEKIVIGTLLAYGRKVRVIGVVPTPTVQLEVEYSDAVGGIAITASHNPEQWNGLKFLDNTGVFLNKEQNEKLWDIIEYKKYSFSNSIYSIKETYDKNAISNHIESVINNTVLKNKNIKKKIKDRKFKIVVDAVNASGSVIVPTLLEMLGCEVIGLHTDESGIFPHTPEPLPINLNGLSDAVKEHNADMGIAVDPDADRLVLIDENGEAIGEEKTIAIAAQNAFRNYNKAGGYSKTAVVNLSTSKMVEDIADEFGFEVFRSPVGEINVVNMMKEKNSLIGGEGSGGVILPASHYGRDSLSGIALLLAELVQSDSSLSELSNDLPSYHMFKYKKEVKYEINSIFSEILQKYKNIKHVTTDGIRLDFEDKWAHIRASNTEPIVRIITEAKIKEDAEQLAHIFLKMF